MLLVSVIVAPRNVNGALAVYTPEGKSTETWVSVASQADVCDGADVVVSVVGGGVVSVVAGVYAVVVVVSVGSTVGVDVSDGSIVGLRPDVGRALGSAQAVSASPMAAMAATVATLIADAPRKVFVVFTGTTPIDNDLMLQGCTPQRKTRCWALARPHGRRLLIGRH